MAGIAVVPDAAHALGMVELMIKRANEAALVGGLASASGLIQLPDSLLRRRRASDVTPDDPFNLLCAPSKDFSNDSDR
jgi:hypothetical protein